MMRIKYVFVSLILFLIFPSCTSKKQEEVLKDKEEEIFSKDGIFEEKEEVIDKESYYKIEIEFPDGEKISFERDLTSQAHKFAFGSTHIAPAVSLAMKDTITSPIFAIIEINIGIILGSSKYPVQTPDVGDYPFSEAPPEVKVSIKNIKYCSCVKGSEGKIHISDWTLDVGGLFAGNFEGKILQETNKEEKLWLKVSGKFHFILPEMQGGQPY